jgi:penicillin-binding protein 1C
VTLFLSDPMARLPSFARMGSVEYPFPVAVKTGTSSRFRDAWAVAYSTRYLVGAWVGDPDFRSMNRLTGYASAAELVQRVLLRLHRDQADGLEDLSFPAPRGFRPLRLCALTGRQATPACERVFLEWLRPGEQPVDDCRAHVTVAVDTRSGRPADARTPRRAVETRTFVDLPPRYAAWAASAGLSPPPRATPPLQTYRVSGRSAPEPRLDVTSPAQGLRLLRDPETPPAQATLALAAVVDPPSPQIVWYVDGAPYVVAEYPYTARWPLVPGEHVFQARTAVGGAASAPVRVSVE